MNRTTSHRITVCTSCRHTGEACRPGYQLIERLRSAIALAGDSVAEDFEVSGTACMAACTRACTVAYHGTRKASYLFGDIDPDEDVADLVEFARQNAVLHDGWCSAVGRPGKLRRTTLARIPATIMAIEDSLEPVS